MKYIYRCDDPKCSFIQEQYFPSFEPKKEIMCQKCGGYSKRDFSEESKAIINHLQ